jgi:Fur family transcriptional regulator, ferric uptake regulator
VLVAKTGSAIAPRAGAYGAGRSTAQRRAVADAVERIGAAFTADDLAARVRAQAPGVSTATVYRSLSAMTEAGHLTIVGERGGAALYARCAEPGHHHHVVCTGCGATAPAPCPVDDAGLAASVPAGFVVTSHEVRLYGLCAACGDRERAERAGACSCDADAHAGAASGRV